MYTKKLPLLFPGLIQHLYCRRRAAEDLVYRRSWGPVEEGNSDLWATIKEPYEHIMTSELMPANASNDSLVGWEA